MLKCAYYSSLNASMGFILTARWQESSDQCSQYTMVSKAPTTNGIGTVGFV